MQKHSNTEAEILQEKDNFLHDLTSTGRERPWDDKKKKGLIVSDTYNYIDMIDPRDLYYKGKRDKIYQCGNWLKFMKDPNSNDKRLTGANFCRQRLCPMCTWRRSLKIFGQVSKVMEELNKTHPTARFIFVTLTVRNVTADKLDDTLKAMTKAFPQLWRSGKLKKSFLGAYRGIEITYNDKEDTYHPHIHAILMVNSSYFKSTETYLSQKELVGLWQKKMKLDYDPSCDIRKVKGNTAKAVAELAKYSVKDDDIVKPEDVDTGAEVIKTLDDVLHGKRLISFYGVMKETHKQLNLSDDIESDNGDLINTDNESKEEKLKKLGWIEETYAFNVGLLRYER